MGFKAILTILLALPSTDWVWKFAKRAGETIEASYWKRLNVLWSKGGVSNPAHPVEKLIEAVPARASVHFIGYHLHEGRKFSSDLLARALLEALWQPVEGETDMNDRTMFQHYVQEMIFKQLAEADDVSTDNHDRLFWHGPNDGGYDVQIKTVVRNNRLLHRVRPGSGRNGKWAPLASG